MTRPPTLSHGPATATRAGSAVNYMPIGLAMRLIGGLEGSIVSGAAARPERPAYDVGAEGDKSDQHDEGNGQNQPGKPHYGFPLTGTAGIDRRAMAVAKEIGAIRRGCRPGRPGRRCRRRGRQIRSAGWSNEEFGSGA